MGAGRTELAMSIFGHSYGRVIAGQVYMHGEAGRHPQRPGRDPSTASPT